MKRLETEYLPYEWMKKDLGLAGAELVLFAAICENRFGLLDGPADYAAVAKKLGMGKSTYFLSRKLLLERGLIRLVKRPGGSMIRLTDKSLEYVERDERLASLAADSPYMKTNAKTSSFVEGLTESGDAEAVLSSLANFLKTALSGVNSLLASISALEAKQKADGKAAQKKAMAEQLGLFD